MEDLAEDMVKVMVEVIMQEHNKLQQIDLNQLDKKMSGLYPLMSKEEMIQRDIKQHKHLPPAVPPPTEERLFTDWSSEDSPRERVNQQIQSARSVESRRTINQTEQTAREPRDDEVLRYVLSDVTTTPSTQIQISQVGARFIDRETNTTEVEIRPPREEMKTDIIHAHSKGIQVPSSNSELSSHDMNIIESPLARPHIPDTMPQLDGPLSVHTRTKRPVPEVRRYTTMPKGNYPYESESDSHDNRSCEGQRYPGRRRHYQDRGGRPPDREDSQDRGYP